MAPDPKPPARIRDPLLLKQFRLEHIGEPCMQCELRPGTRSTTSRSSPRAGMTPKKT